MERVLDRAAELFRLGRQRCGQRVDSLAALAHETVERLLLRLEGGGELGAQALALGAQRFGDGVGLGPGRLAGRAQGVRAAGQRLADGIGLGGAVGGRAVERLDLLAEALGQALGRLAGLGGGALQRLGLGGERRFEVPAALFRLVAGAGQRLRLGLDALADRPVLPLQTLRHGFQPVGLMR